MAGPLSPPGFSPVAAAVRGRVPKYRPSQSSQAVPSKRSLYSLSYL